MATITLRNTKGTPLTNTEVDNNFQNLNNALGAAGSSTIPTPSGTGGPLLSNGPTVNNLTYTGTLTGSTSVLNIGSGQIYKDASGNVGIGTSSPLSMLHLVYAGDVQYRAQNTVSNTTTLMGADNVGAYFGSFSNSAATFYTNSTEKMRIDAAGNVGVGATPTSTSLTLYEDKNLAWKWANGYNYANIFNQASSASLILASGYQKTSTSNGFASSIPVEWAKSAIDVGGNGIKFFTDNASTVAVGTDIVATERVRIDTNGNMIVGTSSTDSTNKLQVAGRIGSTGFSNANGSYPAFSASVLQGYPSYGFTHNLVIENAGTNTYGMSISTTSGGTQSEKVWINSLGNVGIGVVPSAWGSSGWLEFSSTAGISAKGGINLGSNIYYSGTSWKYTTSAGASLYSQGNGAHLWSVATSGTAGNSVSFTQAMALDASGNVGIGTSSPTSKLSVNGDIFLGYGQAIKSATESTPAYNTIIQNYYDSNGNDTLLLKPAGASGGGQIIFAGRTGTEKMRIDNAGNVGIGTSSPSAKLHIIDTNATTNINNATGIRLVNNSTNDYLHIWNYSENAYAIESADETTYRDLLLQPHAGNVGIGTSSPTAKLHVTGEIRATDNITAYYSSDIKFKENIRDINNPLDKVLKIGSKYFDWTDAYIEERGGEDGYFIAKEDFGVIAQDVLSAFPSAVRTRDDGSLAVDYAKLSILSFGAIAELLKRIEILENK